MSNVNRDLDAYAIAFMGDHPDIALSIVPNDMLFGHTIHMSEKLSNAVPRPRSISRTLSAECYATPRTYEQGVIKMIESMRGILTDHQIIGQTSLFEDT